MANSVFKGKFGQMPGVPLPEEDELVELSKLNESPSAAPQLSETQLPPPETDIEAYQRLSQEAEAAAPTEGDVLASGLRKAMSYSRAESPEYLAKMSETAFYKPDAGKTTAVRMAEAEQPDVALTAKQQAQKRLQDLADQSRKRALLPGQMKTQEAKATEAEARATEATARAAKAAGTPLNDVQRKVLEKQFSSLAKEPIDLKGFNKEDTDVLFKALRESPEKGMTEYQKARLNLSERQLGLQQEKTADIRARQESQSSQKEFGKGVNFQGQEYTARTEGEAKDLRKTVATITPINNSLDRIKKEYGNISIDQIENAPKQVQQIGVIGNNLIMSVKELYGLGAPQKSELDFLYNLLGSSPSEIGTAILTDNTIGTSLPEKLDTLKGLYNEMVQERLNTMAVPKESGERAPAKPAAAPAQKAEQGKKPKAKKRKVQSADDLP